MADSPENLDAWVSDLAGALGVDTAEVPTPLILDVTRDVAHGVMRPAGPLSTFIMGLAVGRGHSAEEAARITRELIEDDER